MARPRDGRYMEPHRHQHRGLIADRARAMSLTPFSILAAILVFTEGDFARTEIDLRAVHRLHPPTAGERNNPLRCRVPDAFEIEILQGALGLVADAMCIGPKMPIGKARGHGALLILRLNHGCG